MITGGKRRGVRPTALQLGGTWEPDIWGKVRRAIENAKASAQASAADLANARLSAQMELAADYITLRQLDEQKRFDDATVTAYPNSLDDHPEQVQRRRRRPERRDCRPQTQLHNARAADIELGQQRAQIGARHRHPDRRSRPPTSPSRRRPGP